MISKSFQVDIGFDPETLEFHAHIYSLGDKKIRVCKATKLAPLMKEVSKALRKKEIQNRKFPLPEESRIILATNPEPQFIIPARNGT
jgi:hypothetical protein